MIARDGSGALTFSSVAREIGIAPSALYRYFRDRDELLTALIAEGHDSLGEHIRAEVESGSNPEDALRRGLWAFRRWAQNNSTRFGLIYGPPVGAHETYDATTIGASVITGDVLFAALHRVYGRMASPPISPLLQRAAAATLAHGHLVDNGVENTTSAEMILSGFLVWSHIYGFVAYEVFGHFPVELQPPDVADAMFESIVTAAMAGISAQPVRPLPSTRY